MSLDAMIDAKLDRLLEGQVRQGVILENVERRVGKLEVGVSAEKERLDRRFETDVRPLSRRHDGFNFLLKAVGVAGVVLSLLYTGLQIQSRFALPAPPAPQPSPEVRPHAQVPEVRPRR